MRVRSVTIGTNTEYPVQADRFQIFSSFKARARSLFGDAGIEVQTARLAAQPFPEVLRDGGAGAAVSYARQLEALCAGHGIDYCSIGTVMAAPSEAELAYVEAIPDILRETESVFASTLVAERASGINLAAIDRAAHVIADVARTTPSGFGNLRFSVLANCGPGSPFFPVSYHDGSDTTFAVATEAADLAVDSFARATTLEDARENLRRAVEQAAVAIQRVCVILEKEFGFRFGGIDFSLAPYPETALSIGCAMERLGIDAFGSSGTLFAAAFTTQVLREARFPRCGFSGLMFPVLEDRTLAERSAERLFTLDSLLLYSAVCGTGLDTVPLPGDVGTDELASILLDVASLALVADKPLTARLMPVPGKEAGDMTDYDFSYFANARVLDVKRRGGSRILRNNRFVRLTSRLLGNVT